MKKLFVDNGLLLTDMELTFRGEQLILQRVLVDTGSGSTIISTDLAEKIGIIAEENDMIYRISGVGGSEFVFSKTVNSIKIGNMEVQSFTLEVGAMNYDFNLDGIIGLDLLQEIKAVINIDMLTLDMNK